MPTPSTRLAAPLVVRTAELAGRERPSEDRIFTGDSFVVVLDGASQPDAGPRDGGWYAETLGRELHQRIGGDPDTDSAAILADCILRVAVNNRLEVGNSPSATVAIVKWSADVDVLVLGDSPVIGFTHDGRVQQIRDNRLHQVGQEYRQRLAAAPGFGKDHIDLWRQLVAAERAARNKPGGYWIAEALPAAAHHAYRARWPRSEVAAVLAVTDGVSSGVDRYGVPESWTAALAIAMKDPADLVKLVHDAEASDPRGTRWKRSKVHDDKALALVERMGISSVREQR